MPAKTYEDALREMEKLSQKELQKKMSEAEKICKDYCGECPTYTGTGETDFLFCWTNRSKKIKVAKGCMCPECPVQKSMFQRWYYYCIDGPAKEQLKAVSN